MKQVNRLANETDRGRDAGDAVLGSACHLLVSVRGAGIPPWVGIPVEAHRAPGERPSQTPIGRARLNPPESVRHGRQFGEQGSILCGRSRVQERDPPVFSARNPGKSLTTQSSISHRGRRRKGLAGTASKVLASCCLFLTKNLSAVPAPESSTSFCQSVGQGFRLDWVAVRSAPYASVGKGFTGCGQSVGHSAVAAIPSWALRGEKPRSSRSRPGRTGITPPGFWAVETLEKPDNESSIRPRPMPAQGFWSRPAQIVDIHRTRNSQELNWN